MATECTDILLIGFGSVSQHLCQILLKKTFVNTSTRKKIRVVGACDSSGAVYCPEGLPLQELLDHKKQSGLQNFKSKKTNIQLKYFDNAEHLTNHTATYVDVLVDASPVNLDSGFPGLQCARHALEKHTHVVFANKAPLVLDYLGLCHLAEQNKVEIAFSATVCGGLPVVNVGRRDLIGAEIQSIEGIFNSTSNYILSQMAAGKSNEEALKEAQRTGIAEADPHLDVAGIDTANKLIIIANSILKVKPPVSLGQLKITGIEQLTKETLDSALKEGYAIRLVAKAELQQGSNTYTFSVQPTKVKSSSFLANCTNTDMCIVFTTDIYETISMKTNETGVYPTSAAVLRDIVNLKC
eukprot:Awhi_evm1s2735